MTINTRFAGTVPSARARLAGRTVHIAAGRGRTGEGAAAAGSLPAALLQGRSEEGERGVGARSAGLEHVERERLRPHRGGERERI